MEISFSNIVQIISDAAIPVVILLIVGYGIFKKVKLYEAFVEGAKGGFEVAIKIIPFLVAILVAIGMFRASGATGCYYAAIVRQRHARAGYRNYANSRPGLFCRQPGFNHVRQHGNDILCIGRIFWRGGH